MHHIALNNRLPLTNLQNNQLNFSHLNLNQNTTAANVIHMINNKIDSMEISSEAE